jgi:hypothetical protein
MTNYKNRDLLVMVAAVKIAMRVDFPAAERSFDGK